MKKGQVWSEEFDSYVSRAFLARKDGIVTIDLSHCTLMLNRFGFFDLMLGGRPIKRVDYDFYKKHRKNVKGFVKEVMEL